MPLLSAILWIVGGLLLQFLFFDHMPLAGGLVLSYLLVILHTPVEWNRHVQIVLGFVLGLIVDIFCNTPGLHALACTTTMWLRLPLLHMFVVADDIKNGRPSLQRLGNSVFARFLAIMLGVHCVLLFVVESFTLFNFLDLFLKIVFSFSMTFLVLGSLEMVSIHSRR